MPGKGTWDFSHSSQRLAPTGTSDLTVMPRRRAGLRWELNVSHKGSLVTASLASTTFQTRCHGTRKGKHSLPCTSRVAPSPQGKGLKREGQKGLRVMATPVMAEAPAQEARQTKDRSLPVTVEVHSYPFPGTPPRSVSKEEHSLKMEKEPDVNTRRNGMKFIVDPEQHRGLGVPTPKQ